MHQLPYTNDPVAVRAILRPLLEWDLLSWKGLPELSVETLNAALGRPGKADDAQLGWYPARRFRYPIDSPSGGLTVYARNNQIVLVETLVPPPISAMEGLGEPSAIKPHEILVENAYVHEYLFCEKGLVLSIAEPFEEDQPGWIVRCRGIQPIESPDQFGPEFYQQFEDSVVW